MQTLGLLLRSRLSCETALVAPGIVTPILHRFFGTKRLYVGNLPWEATAEDLANHFGSCGQVKDVVIPLDKLGRSKGFGFVEMESTGADAATDKLHESQFMGRTIFINEAKPREERRERPDGYNRQRGRRNNDDGWGQQQQGGGEQF